MTRPWNKWESADADGADDEAEASGNKANGAGLQACDEEAEGQDRCYVDGIAIRTFSDWDELRPGSVEIDLVSHEGGNARGDCAYTLDAADACTGWTETEAVRNRAENTVFAGLEKALTGFPFAIYGIDSGYGSAFINNHLFHCCTENRITFTRSRPYRKSDNCFVEQKNHSIVRKAVGYRRYDAPQELEALNELYGVLTLYTDYFQPSMKLIERTRNGRYATNTLGRGPPTAEYWNRTSFLNRQRMISCRPTQRSTP